MSDNNPPTGKPCYRCDNFVRMSGPEAARDPNTWTICAVCRDKLNLEAKVAGGPGVKTEGAA